jgi:hypothetical protein
MVEGETLSLSEPIAFVNPTFRFGDHTATRRADRRRPVTNRTRPADPQQRTATTS